MQLIVLHKSLKDKHGVKTGLETNAHRLQYNE